MYVYSFATCASVQRFASRSLQSSFFSFPIGIYMEALFINALLRYSAGRFLVQICILLLGRQPTIGGGKDV